MAVEHQQVLRALSINLDSCFESTLGISLSESGTINLDERTRALVRLGALVALDAPAPATHAMVSAAQAAGSGDDDIVGVLFAVAPIVGTPRVVSAAARLAEALGYDLDEALCGWNPDDHAARDRTADDGC